MKVYMYIPLK